MNSLVIIPARAGSKGLKNKNFLKLNGKALILHTVDEARKIFSDSEIYVSTDSAKIKNIVENSGLKVDNLSKCIEIYGERGNSEDALQLDSYSAKKHVFTTVCFLLIQLLLIDDIYFGRGLG